MSSKKGFAPLLIIILIGLGLVASTAFIIYRNQTPNLLPKEETKTADSPSSPSAEPIATPTAFPSPTKPKVPPPTTVPVTPTTTGKISFHIGQVSERACGQYTCISSDQDDPPTMLDRFTFRIVETATNQRWEKSGVRDWTMDNLTSGNYKLMVYFKDPYQGSGTSACENCHDFSGIGENGMCGFQTKLSSGENPKLICKFKIAGSTTPDSSDKTPPTTNIYYPQNGGSITYKIDNKVCAITTAPTDNTVGTIETQFAFDSGSMSDWKSGQGYLCADSLPNGSHTLSYHSKDAAENIETVRTINFTVNIPGN